MSRGLGTLQRQLLAHLGQGGRWRFVYELAAETYADAHPGEDSYPLSFYVSAMRAVRSLAKRDLVHYARIQAGLLGQESLTVACWLPDQESPFAPDPRLGTPRHKGK